MVRDSFKELLAPFAPKTVGHVSRSEVLEEAALLCEQMASSAYVAASVMARSDLCLGEQAKITAGNFTLENLKALEAVRAKFGAHFALAEAAKAIRLLAHEIAGGEGRL